MKQASPSGCRELNMPETTMSCVDGATPELADVRWLRDQVLAPFRSSGAADLPSPSLVSTCLKDSASPVRDYVLWWIAHPDSQGDFAARTRWTRWMPAAMLLRAMLWLGYDGIVYLQGEVILGHVFFQRRGTSLRGFSTAVAPGLVGSGCSVGMMLDYLAYAAAAPGVTRARVGRGRNNVTARLLARLRRHESRLGWHVGQDGWVTFQRGDIAPSVIL